MAEEVKTEVTPEVKTEQTPEVKEVDLISRVSQVKIETPKKEEESKFNINDLDSEIEKLPDPKLKEQMLGLKKSLLKGENQKYQEIANLRKQYEQELAKINTWTPERLQQELNRPDFVQSANTVLQSSQPQEDTSNLSDTERAKIQSMERELMSLKGQNFQALKMQYDTQLKTKFQDYAPDVVDTGFEQLVKMNPIEVREHVFKAIKHDEHVRMAYELGKQDRLNENQEKLNSMSFDSGRNISTPNKVEPQKGETAQSFFLRSYQEHAKKK